MAFHDRRPRARALRRRPGQPQPGRYRSVEHHVGGRRVIGGLAEVQLEQVVDASLVGRWLPATAQDAAADCRTRPRLLRPTPASHRRRSRDPTVPLAIFSPGGPKRTLARRRPWPISSRSATVSYKGSVAVSDLFGRQGTVEEKAETPSLMATDFAGHRRGGRLVVGQKQIFPSPPL